MSGPSIPGYENLTMIGKGGFSRVYRAEQAKLKRQVAVKVLNFGLNDESDRLSFERETELMGRVSTHPNIVTVHDTAFTNDGQPCIVMELYPGGSLADLIGDRGTLTPKETVEVGVAIASALDASHNSGVVHCDLKPQNILISQFGQPALGDFGISTFTEERTRTGSDAGAGFTLPYAAPEIIEGESPSIGTDVYSLAATLYTALAGRRPFAAPKADQSKPSAAEQARRILLEDVVSLVDEGVPASLDHVICSAMAKERSDRPVSAAEFANQLYDVGQRLGYSTSVPRTAERASLRTQDPSDFDAAAPAIDMTRMFTGPRPDVIAELDGQVKSPLDPVAPEPVAPDLFVDASDGLHVTDQTEARAGAALALETDTPAAGDVTGESGRDPSQPAAVESAPAERTRNTRQISAIIFGLISLLGVGAILFVVSQSGGESNEQDVIPTPIAQATGVAVNPPIAPARPTNVQAQRLGNSDALVLWDVAASDTDSADVSYEVRVQGDTGREVVTTMDGAAVIRGIAAQDTVCMTVLAIRANRVSTVSDPACVAPTTGVVVETNPAICQVRPCRVELTLTGFAPDLPITVEVFDSSFTTVSNSVATYEPAGQTNSQGQLGGWEALLGDAAPAGDYVVLIEDTAGGIYGAVVTIAAP